MADSQDVQEIRVSVTDFEDLQKKLYETALRHRETFDGIAVSFSGGADIYVEASDEGKRLRYLFVNPNPMSMASFHRQLEATGYLNGSRILHEDIIRDSEREDLEVQRAMAAMVGEKEDEARAQRTVTVRSWAQVLFQAAIFVVINISIVLATRYWVPSVQDQKIRQLEQRIDEIQKRYPATAPLMQPKPSRH